MHTRPTEYPDHIRGLWYHFPLLAQKNMLGYFSSFTQKNVPKSHNVFIIVVADVLLIPRSMDSKGHAHQLRAEKAQPVVAAHTQINGWEETCMQALVT